MDAAGTGVQVLRVALALVFAGMGISHFVPSVRRSMRAMIPPALRRPGFPSPAALVAFTGLCELAGAIGIVAPWQLLGLEWVRWLAGAALVVFLIAVFPANAYAAEHPEKFGRAAFPFWPRYLAQLGLIVLVTLATAPGVGGQPNVG
ncbi:MAG: DoxX family protein [Pseudolysinimonas sp.]